MRGQFVSLPPLRPSYSFMWPVAVEPSPLVLGRLHTLYTPIVRTSCTPPSYSRSAHARAFSGVDAPLAFVLAPVHLVPVSAAPLFVRVLVDILSTPRRLARSPFLHESSLSFDAAGFPVSRVPSFAFAFVLLCFPARSHLRYAVHALRVCLHAIS